MKTALVTTAAILFLGACGPKPAKEVRTPTPQAMNASNAKNERSSFEAHLPEGLAMPADDVGKRLLSEYGALSVARGVKVPGVVVFKDAAEVNGFQTSTGSAIDTISGVKIELQEAPMRALKDAARDASSAGLSITPRGSDAATRSYEDTVELWKSRVEPGLDHWQAAGRINADDAKRIRALAPFDQVSEIFRLEEQGIFFSKDFAKPIIYSVAPPGASQHLAMLALDVSEFDNAAVRQILARHGWFQTVVSDLPHFTYLGMREEELPALGLKKVTNADRAFWVPDL